MPNAFSRGFFKVVSLETFLAERPDYGMVPEPTSFEDNKACVT